MTIDYYYSLFESEKLFFGSTGIRMSDPIAIRQYQYEYIYIWYIYTLWRMIARNVAAYDTLPESILTVTA